MTRTAIGLARLLAGLLAATAPAQPALADEFSWTQGQPSAVLHSTSTHWCVLTNVHGRMHGNGERVELGTDKGRWVLSGASQQEGVGGVASCFPVALLKPAGATRMLSARMARMWWGAGDCSQSPIKAWWGDAFTAISGFGGNQRGGGEYLEVRQSNGGRIPTLAFSHGCDKQVFGAVMSYFVGTPDSGRLARFAGPNGTNLTAAEAGEYAVRNGGGTRIMARVNDAACYLTYVGGAFNGGGEAARIFQQNGRWALRAESKSGDGVWARARCFMFDQRS